MGCKNPTAKPSLSPDLYKEEEGKGEGIGRKIGRFLCKNSPEILETVDIGYYSGGGPSHFKISRLFPFSDHFLPFHYHITFRGVDLIVGSNFTPTFSIYGSEIYLNFLLRHS